MIKKDLTLKATHQFPSLKSHKILNEITKTDHRYKNSTNNFDFFHSFTYTDHITNNTILFDSTLPLHPKQDSTCFQSLKSSLSLIKSTRKFHLKTLKEKNYRSANLAGSLDNTIINKENKAIKYLVRKTKQRQTFKREKIQLSQLLSKHNPTLCLSNNISLVNSARKKRVEENSEGVKGSKADVLQQFEKSVLEERQKWEQKSHNQRKKSQVWLNFQEMSLQQIDLIHKIDRQLRREIRKNAEYLIIPDKSKIAIEPKYKKKKCKPKQPTEELQISEYCFKCEEQQQVLKKYKLLKTKHKNTKAEMRAQQKDLIQSIKDGNHSKVQINLSMHPELMNVREKSNHNNILHLSIIYNRPDIFALLTKKCREGNIDLLNLPNKYKKTPAHLCRIYKDFYQKYKALEAKQPK